MYHPNKKRYWLHYVDNLPRSTDVFLSRIEEKEAELANLLTTSEQHILLLSLMFARYCMMAEVASVVYGKSRRCKRTTRHFMRKF